MLTPDLFAEATRLLEAGQPFALATVVHTRGSTPQKAGARLLVRADGTMVGTLGGGCLEAEVWQEAASALRHGDGPSLRDFSLSDDLAAESGMVCGGTMTVFVEPMVGDAFYRARIQVIEAALAGGEAAVVATVVAAPHGNGLGATLFVQGEGVWDSLGEASWDEAALEVCRRLQADGGTDLIPVTGEARVFVESFRRPPTLLAVGAGHIAQALCPLAQRLGFQVAVLDDRPEFANRELFPEADEVIVADIAQGVREFPISPSTAVVIATRGHKQDSVALREAIRSAAGYLGMVSSRRKLALIYLQLLEEGISPERLQSVHAPIGLDIGARTPEEIALSIMAEILMVRSRKHGGSLKLKEGRLPKAKKKANPSFLR